MAKRPLVALLIETSNSYARGLLRGIHAYLREHRPWSIYLPELGRGDTPPNWLKAWSGDPSRFEDGQRAFYHRARLNGAARRGAYTADMEREAA